MQTTLPTTPRLLMARAHPPPRPLDPCAEVWADPTPIPHLPVHTEGEKEQRHQKVTDGVLPGKE